MFSAGPDQNKPLYFIKLYKDPGEPGAGPQPRDAFIKSSKVVASSLTWAFSSTQSTT